MNIDITLAEALERASARLREKMLHSVELLQKAEKIALNYDAEQGYYLAFSGGKDSQALYHMTQLAGVRFQGHMNLTSVDPPEVIRFVKKNYPEVELIKPGKSIFQHAIEKQILPTIRVRWCCAEYKETAGAGKVTLIGIRKAESSRRAKRNEVEINNRKFSGDLDGLEEYRQEQKAKRARRKSKEQGVNITNADEEKTLGCIHGKESLLISPIIYWTEQDVWEFLNDVVMVPHCSLYDEGWHRIGCIGCPMSSHKQKMLENERYPHIKRGWIRAIKAIRNGGVFKRGYIWWNVRKDWMPLRNVRGLLRTQAVTSSIPTPNIGWGGGKLSEVQIQENHCNELASNTISIPTKRIFGERYRKSEWNAMWTQTIKTGGGISDNLTDEQENEIAENIYDWWISGKSYKQWYAEKFQQMKLDFGEEL